MSSEPDFQFYKTGHIDPLDYICKYTKRTKIPSMLSQDDPKEIETIIFDLGGVLIDWEPRYLYRKIFEDEVRMEWFLEHICTPDWNEEQDGGRSLQAAMDLLIGRHPEWEAEIRAFYGRWSEMLGGAIGETVDILRQIKSTGRYRLYALTNWSAETWPVAWEQFRFLHEFDGVLVSGQERLKKPDPTIYHLLLDRYEIDPTRALFIDDNLRNVQAAEACGIPSVHFIGAGQLKAELFPKLGLD